MHVKKEAPTTYGAWQDAAVQHAALQQYLDNVANAVLIQRESRLTSKFFALPSAPSSQAVSSGNVRHYIFYRGLSNCTFTVPGTTHSVLCCCVM